jgi:hypothetical protein
VFAIPVLTETAVTTLAPSLQWGTKQADLMHGMNDTILGDR